MSKQPVGSRDPFEVLGVSRTASIAEVRAARRRLAFDHHPDRGGDAQHMRELNSAFDSVIAHLTGRREFPVEEPAVPADKKVQPSDPLSARQQPKPRWSGRAQHDAPSFVIDALPAEAFEALLVVTSWIGEVLVDDPPYQLEVHLYEPVGCWCRLDIVADAGSCTVSLTVAAVGDVAPPLVDDVRDVWVHHLNLPGAFA